MGCQTIARQIFVSGHWLSMIFGWQQSNHNVVGSNFICSNIPCSKCLKGTISIHYSICLWPFPCCDPISHIAAVHSPLSIWSFRGKSVHRVFTFAESWNAMSLVLEEANRVLWHWKTFPIILPPPIESKMELQHGMYQIDMYWDVIQDLDVFQKMIDKIVLLYLESLKARKFKVCYFKIAQI